MGQSAPAAPVSRLIPCGPSGRPDLLARLRYVNAAKSGHELSSFNRRVPRVDKAQIGTIDPGAAAENATLDDVIDKHDPAKSRGNIMRTADFIARWTNQEYLKLEQKRASDIAAGKIGNAKNWDVVVAEDYIDMNKKKFQNLKADLVADEILTPARADAIFDTPTVAT